MSVRMRRAVMAALLATAWLPPVQAQAPGGDAQYSMPARPLGEALREVSLRSGRSVIVDSELVDSLTAPPLAGRYGPEEALHRLLRGSGLVARETADGFVIERGDAAEGEEDDIVVTGTNIRGAKPAAPVIIVTRRDIEESGRTSLEQLMRLLPQNDQGGTNQENLNAPLAGVDSTEHGAGLNLRGLGQRATLVLLDGRRLAPSSGGSFVDVSLIPLSAVERVEVVTDGASAIYGSDAVGGVVNFVLRDRFEGRESSIALGTATSGDGDQLQLSQLSGTDWRRGHALLAYEFRAEDEIVAGDRPFTINLRPETFLLPRERRHSALAVVGQDLTSRLRFDLQAMFGHRASERSYFFTGVPQPVGQKARADALSFAGSFSWQVGGNWLARLEGAWSHSRGYQLTTQPGAAGLVNERETDNDLGTLAAKLDGTAFELPAGALRVAAGVEWRTEAYRDLNSTSTVTNNLRRAERDVRSAYAEVLVPLFSERNGIPGLRRLELSAAVRHESYTGFGSTLNPRGGLVWSPIEGLDLRAAYDTSFRAPLLSEAAGAYNAIYVPATLLHVNRAEARGVGLLLTGANPGVGPERSRSWTFGAELRPRRLPGLDLSLNYYSILFRDRIALPSRSIVVVGNPAFESIVTRGPAPALSAGFVAGADLLIDISGPGFTNGHARPEDVTVLVDDRINNTAVTRTRGFDILLRYAFERGGNRFAVQANVNHAIGFSDRLTPGSAEVLTLDTPYHPIDWRGRASFSWSRGGLNANLSVQHSDGYRDDRAAAVKPVSSFTTVDLGLGYEVGRNTRVSLFAQNLLDSAPPHIDPDPRATAGLGYDPVNASARGRFVSVQLRQKW